MITFSGFKVVVSPLVQPVPAVQLSHDFNAVSPEFKAEFNAWLLERFGWKDVFYIVNGALIVNPKIEAAIRCNVMNEAWMRTNTNAITM